MTEERLDWHFWNWARWHLVGRYGNGYPSRASGGIGKSNSTDFDTMVAVADVRCAFAVEAALGDCTPAERASVHNKYLNCVYVLRDEEQHYNNARDTIKKALTRHGIE